MSYQNLEAELRSARFVKSFDQRTATLATQVINSPIQVPESPPSFAREITWLEVSYGLLSSMPLVVQAAITIRPGELESVVDGLLSQLLNVSLEARATNISAQQTLLFGLPILQPDKADIFPKVVSVADGLGATHEQLLTSVQREGRKTAESLILMQNLVFWLYEKVLEMLTNLMAEETSLKKTKVDLQLSSPYAVVEHNHRIVSPQINERLNLITTNINDLDTYLRQLSNMSQALKMATDVPRYALGLRLARPRMNGIQ